MKIYIINLPKDKERRGFQVAQLRELDLDYEIVNAISTNNIEKSIYDKHKYDWERPLRKVEVACYYSHRHLWEKIIANNQPALIMEDDAMLSKHLPNMLQHILTLNDIDYINLEVVGRRKIVSKKSLIIPSSNSKLYRLYLDRNGTGGYILYPSGAKKLLTYELQTGIGLADAHINACDDLIAYQIEPAALIQLDQCEKYGITPPLNIKSNIETLPKPAITFKDKWHFGFKRASAQIRQAIRQILYYFQSQKRSISIQEEDFLLSHPKKDNTHE